ncbi:hypothetical protein EVG20_g7951 [Dentipellis fragilis]|uniref:Uncharacterized protein n=1 Tax=Dentipellis fragilis TaxID=205917 RepID=A0A4Y9YDP5_9AGAM|nr:hypothetical protein EVG20_g7951 [Dentipellis fragilis]
MCVAIRIIKPTPSSLIPPTYSLLTLHECPRTGAAAHILTRLMCAVPSAFSIQITCAAIARAGSSNRRRRSQYICSLAYDERSEHPGSGRDMCNTYRLRLLTTSHIRAGSAAIFCAYDMHLSRGGRCLSSASAPTPAPRRLSCFSHVHLFIPS